jgi:Tyrosine-protein kinase ephrin type A/B receptor-like
MGKDAFISDVRIAYVSGVASALNVVDSAVEITSITEQTLGRRLLTGTIAVETAVIVTAEELVSVGSAVTAGNLNAALADANIQVVDIYLPPCKPGYVGVDGEFCSLCTENSFCPGGNVSTSCPANTQSRVGSISSLDCICKEGWYDTLDGECHECEPGSWCYASVQMKCPRGSTTLGSGAQYLIDCICDKGYYGVDGVECTKCGIGTYKTSSGSATCTDCDSNTYSTHEGAISVDTCTKCTTPAISARRSGAATNCSCPTGYTGANTNCIRITTPTPIVATTTPTPTEMSVVFTATILMGKDAFIPTLRTTYVSVVASALKVADSAVKITSVTEQTLRRRLLAQTIAVETTVNVTPEQLAYVTSAVTYDNLRRKLATGNIQLSDVSTVRRVVDNPQTTNTQAVETTPTSVAQTIPTEVIAAVVGAIAVLVWIFRFKRRNRRREEYNHDKHHHVDKSESEEHNHDKRHNEHNHDKRHNEHNHDKRHTLKTSVFRKHLENPDYSINDIRNMMLSKTV